MNSEIRPFSIAFDEAELDDLHARLKRVRFPEKETVEDSSQGVPLVQMRALIQYWQARYDWRRCEAALNAHDNFLTEIDGLDLHFMHIRSPHENALPLIMTHGWPGSVLEFLKVIGPLIEPEKHGGKAEEAFHLVIPSLPGYGFSGKPKETGWDVKRIASAWHELMARLGYRYYVAHGGDWGAAITTAMGIGRPEALRAVHVTLPLVVPKDPGPSPSPAELRTLEQLKTQAKWGSGYSMQQMTRPQTLGYTLADSPIGQAAWILEKYAEWSDHDGNVFDAISMDEVLDNVTLYWLTNSGASSARLYWESFRKGFRAVAQDCPTGCSIFPKDIFSAPRSWAERCMSEIIYWNDLERGGHFPALEQPELLAREIRQCFTDLR